METKICNKCPENGEQPIENFRILSSGVTLNMCKKCNNRKATITRRQQIIANVSYREKRKSIRTGINKKHYAQNKEYHISRVREYKRSSRKIVNDYYVKTLLTDDTQISWNNITPELIELQIESIQLHRQLKQIQS